MGMNEAVTKLSAARSQLTDDLLASEKKISNLQIDLERAQKSNEQILSDCNARIERALAHKVDVDKDVDEINKIAKSQHQMLQNEIEHLHAQLKASRDEQPALRTKAQLHYSRRKEEWKKLKQLESQS